MIKLFKKALLPLGFKAAGVASGIKRSGKLDLALFFSSVPAKASARFTTNTLPAAPVQLCRAYLAHGASFQAILANSGNANCFTGLQGFLQAQVSSRVAADLLGIKKEAVLIASTGIIARTLPVDKIKAALPRLVSMLSKQGIGQAKKAILTTDTYAKECTVKFRIGTHTVTLAGIAKGAGMISPDMATMLSFIFTDAHISQAALDTALAASVAKTFNCITVDGCMSTNDSVIVLANGQAKNALIETHKNFSEFSEALHLVCLTLAKMMIRDAEGASKFIEINVTRAKSFEEARKVALSIANSALFKTAIYGENPNFGRIVASIGASGVRVKEKDLMIKVSSLRKKEVKVLVSLQRGTQSATVYTSDLTPEYIKVNAEYN